VTFKVKYTKSDVLNIITPQPKSTAAIMKELDVARNTAKSYLTQLEKEGKIQKSYIEGSSFGWIRTAPQNKLPIKSEVDIKKLEDIWNQIFELSYENPDNEYANIISTLISPDQFCEEFYDENCTVECVDMNLMKLRELLLRQ
jgi:hypothetical protein